MTDPHTLQRTTAVALVAVGGFAGANLRYLVARVDPGLAGTLLVNVAGSAALGFLLYAAIHAGVLSGRSRILLGSGFLSSFTTYSTFAVEVATAAPAVALGYVVASYALGFAGVLVGRSLALRVPADPFALRGGGG